MKKVLLFTQWFDPEPTFKGLVFAKELIKQGFEVEVLTGVPNYPTGIVYKGYENKIFQEEIMDGIKIKRVYLFPNHDSSAFKRILNYISFALSSLVYLLFFQSKVDVIYAYHPPLSIGAVAIITKFFRRIPVVYDIQDMWPDTLKATGMINNRHILDFIGFIAKIIYKNVNVITVLSPGFKKILLDRDVSHHKIEVIENWCDEQSINSDNSDFSSKVELPGNNNFKLLFAGNIGKAQGLSRILDTSTSLREEIDFIFLGNGVEKSNLVSRKERERLENIHFLEAVPVTEVGNYFKEASALLVFLNDDPLFEITIPSKTQAYMSYGKPIVMGVKGDASDLVSKANCGVCIDPNSFDLLVSQLKDISQLDKETLSRLGNNGKNYYKNNLSLSAGASKFAAIFNKLIT